MSRFFSVGPFPFGVAARFGAALLAVIFFAVAFFAVVFLEVAFLLISAPELALDRSTRFRVRSKRAREVHLDICRYGHIFGLHGTSRHDLRCVQRSCRAAAAADSRPS